MVELTRRGAGFKPSGNSRESKFLAEFEDGRRVILQTDALVNLGAARNRAEWKGFKVGGRTTSDRDDLNDNTDLIQPFAKKDQFNNK